MKRAAVILLLLLAGSNVYAATRKVAVTFDDLPAITADDDTTAEIQRITINLLAALQRQRVPAVGFVNEDKLTGEGEVLDPARVQLIEQWLASGCQIGNHTYSHKDLHQVGPDEFERDIVRGEAVIRPMIESRGLKLRWFRHPYLDAGKTVADRDRINSFLSQHGYAVAPVTIDDSEWIYDLAYHRARAYRRPFIRSSYIRYMRERFAWDESKSRRVFDREIPQVLLLHASALNADAFDRLAAMIRSRGYEFITIDEATSDPAYTSPEAVIDGGVSWLERWGVARGISDDGFENDPKVPQWIQDLAGSKDE